MEVFVAYMRDSSIDDLKKTLEAWEQDDLEPVAVQVHGKKFEIERRVIAENLAAGNYVLASLGTGPFEDNFCELAEKMLADNPKAGLVKPCCIETDWVSGRVTICRKGVITHWIKPEGSQEADVLHANAHAQSCRHAGYEVIECRTIHYRLLSASLPC